MKQVYAIEGLDRLGKSTLIGGLQNSLGFFNVIHFGKPQKLKAYEDASVYDIARAQEYEYQKAGFINSMLLAKSGARVIFDRWHLGEVVYAPLYRAYSGNYVFDIEKNAMMQEANQVRLILLVENFNISRHFKTDGDSFDDRRREEEQELFIDAMARSIIPDKMVICVTAPDGGFRPSRDILAEALS
jgi:thymidylate kinase